MRASGVRDVLTYCRDHGCSHSTTVNADRGPDGSSKSMRIEIEAARELMVRQLAGNVLAVRGHDCPRERR